ncbi:MAG: flavodoxin family protein [Planctomycetota bacterium]|jgi:multimeric flavodoxin WrbA
MGSPSILVLCGSPRETGNTQTLVNRFAEGAREGGADVEVVRTFDRHIKPCRGCLRCNILGRCSLKGDDWPEIAQSFTLAKGVLFATPIYFHHVSGNLKLAIDRFRSLVHVRMVPHGVGLEHSPRYDPEKAYALILVQGGTGEHGVKEIRDLIEFIAGFGDRPRPVETLVASGAGISGQIRMTEEELTAAYRKLGLPLDRVEADVAVNQELRDRAMEMGRRMAERIR